MVHGFRRRLLVLALVVFGLSSLLAGGHSYAIDNEVQFQTTRSLLNLRPDLEGVDQGWLVQPNGPYRVVEDGSVVGIVPIGQSLLSVPFYLAGRLGAELVGDDQQDQFVRTATFFTDSLLLALTAVVVALLARELMDRETTAVLLGYVYAFGTYALGNAQTYLTEIGTSLFVALACWLAIRAWSSHRPLVALAAGSAIGMAFMVRPSAALFIPIIGLVLAVTIWGRRGFSDAAVAGAAFVAGCVVMLGINSLFAWWRFGDPLDLGYEVVRQDHPLLSGFTGQIWSLGKGVIWYAPVVLLSAVGAVLLVRRRTPEVILLVAAVLANTLFYGRVPFWSGDNSWGPRYTLIILPLLVPLAIGLRRWEWGTRAIAVAGVVGLLVVGLPGTLVNFNVLYIRSTRELGAGMEVSAIRNEMEWQPIISHLEMIPDAVGDALGTDRRGELERPDYTAVPADDYGFFGVEPRLDVWWAWIGPTHASSFTWLFLLPSLLSLGVAGKLVVDGGHPRGVRSRAKATASVSWSSSPEVILVRPRTGLAVPQSHRQPRPTRPEVAVQAELPRLVVVVDQPCGHPRHLFGGLRRIPGLDRTDRGQRHDAGVRAVPLLRAGRVELLLRDDQQWHRRVRQCGRPAHPHLLPP